MPISLGPEEGPMLDNLTRALADYEADRRRRISLDRLSSQQLKDIGFRRVDRDQSPVRFADFG